MNLQDWADIITIIAFPIAILGLVSQFISLRKQISDANKKLDKIISINQQTTNNGTYVDQRIVDNRTLIIESKTK